MGFVSLYLRKFRQKFYCRDSLLKTRAVEDSMHSFAFKLYDHFTKVLVRLKPKVSGSFVVADECIVITDIN